MLVRLAFSPGGEFSCGSCLTRCKAVGHQPKEWRGLNLFHHQTIYAAPVPRVTCPSCGVRQADLPWARPGGEFTYAFEYRIAELASEIPLRAVAEIMDVDTDSLLRVVRHIKDPEAADGKDEPSVASHFEPALSGDQDSRTMAAPPTDPATILSARAATYWLFNHVLDLDEPWFVERVVELDKEEQKLSLLLNFHDHGPYICGACGASGAKKYDTRPLKTWRHLDCLHYRTMLWASVPRVTCSQCGIRQAELPWARERSGFTLDFEQRIATLASKMSLRAVAEIVDETPAKLQTARSAARSDGE